MTQDRDEAKTLAKIVHILDPESYSPRDPQWYLASEKYAAAVKIYRRVVLGEECAGKA